jgi:membrane protein YdbS with pleckstrin-like domain
VSGRVYTFTPFRRVQQVEAADAPLLLRSRLFRAAR